MSKAFPEFRNCAEQTIMTTKRGHIMTSHTAGGLPRYEVEIRHDDLGKYQIIRGDDPDVVEQKAQAKMHQWDDMWDRKQKAEEKRLDLQQRAEETQDKKDLAAERTEEAKAALEALDTVLAHTLEVDNTVAWESLKNFSDYPKPKPGNPSLPQKPDPFQKPTKPSASEFLPGLRIFDVIG